MDKDKDISAMTTISDFLTRSLREDGEDLGVIREYLMSMFLSSATDALFEARRTSGLTQAQLAQKLGKKQSAIARWEADLEGKMSLRQYVEIAQACGVSPFAMSLEPLEPLRDFVINNPEVLPTQKLYQAWAKKESEPLQISLPHTFTIQATISVAPLDTISLRQGIQTVRATEQIFNDPKQAIIVSSQIPSDNVMNDSFESLMLKPYPHEANQSFAIGIKEKLAA